MRNRIATDGKGFERELVIATFGDTRRGTIKIEPTDTVHFAHTYWDGGTRHTYAGICLTTKQRVRLPNYNPPQFGGPSEIAPYTTVPGVAIVEKTDFRGRVFYTVYVHPSNAAKMLPAAAKTVTDRDKALLGVFGGIIAAARGKELLELDATTDELQSLQDRGLIKCHKGKRPQRIGERATFVGYGKGFQGWKYPYDLGGAKITTDGKNCR